MAKKSSKIYSQPWLELLLVRHLMQSINNFNILIQMLIIKMFNTLFNSLIRVFLDDDIKY